MQAWDLPGGGLPTRSNVHDRNVPGIRHIDERPACRRVELERFGMGLERKVGDLGVAVRVDHGKRTLAVSDEHPVARCIDADVVGIVAQVDPSIGREIATPQDANRPVAGVGDIDLAGRRHVADALRFAKSGERAQGGHGLEIDHAHRVIAQLGDEQPLVIEIDRQVIDPSAHIAERDFSLELEPGLDRPGGSRSQQASRGRRESARAKPCKPHCYACLL